MQETSAEALQTIADITLAVLADKKTAVPDALLQTAVLLHDTALLVRPSSCPCLLLTLLHECNRCTVGLFIPEPSMAEVQVCVPAL